MQYLINALKSITSIGTGFIPQTASQDTAMMAYFRNEYKGDWKSAYDYYKYNGEMPRDW
tara:strand:- start:1644 stop:1820 length:177 start_codon:yes stop_codon:yes gene_type:complete